MSTTREEQRRQTRRRIYECALAIFRRDGVVACRTEDIANAAGISRGSFYFHFPTKEHVLLERMRETEDEIRAVIEQLPAEVGIDRVLAIEGAELLRGLGFESAPIAFFLAFVLVVAVANLFMGSASAKWAA
ncbi:MAG: TetR family transcriptional regulator [Deltaproteobacteria bacterium]|nr:TetR family transcriptional regulator [Deltaproteobacteria bacterium]